MDPAEENVQRKIRRGEKLTLYETVEAAAFYQASAEASIQSKRVAEKLEQRVEQLRRGDALDISKAKILEGAIAAHKKNAGEEMRLSKLYHKGVLDSPRGAEILEKVSISPDQGAINDFVKKAEALAEEAIKEAIANREEPQREQRGRQEGRGKGRGKDKKPGGSKPRGKKFKAEIEESMQDAAVVLVRLEHGEGDKGSGVEQRKPGAHKSPVIG